MQRGLMMTLEASANSARERACRSLMPAKALGGRSSSRFCACVSAAISKKSAAPRHKCLPGRFLEADTCRIAPGIRAPPSRRSERASDRGREGARMLMPRSVPARHPVGPPVTTLAAPISPPVPVRTRPHIGVGPVVVGVGPVVTITVPRPAYPEFDTRSLKVDALRQAGARAGNGHGADKAERNHRPRDYPHDTSFLVSRPTPNPPI